MNNLILQDMYYTHSNIKGREYDSVGCELSEFNVETFIESTNVPENALILNTCAVTEKAQLASEYVAKWLSIFYPEKALFFIGCGTKYSKNVYNRYGTILSDTVTANKNINSKNNYIKIQEGCDKKCAYCVVNKLKGKPVSVDINTILSNIDMLVKTGVTAIELIGTEILQYNYNGLTIIHLCEHIIANYPEIEISLNACDPSSEHIFDLVALINENKNMKKRLYLSVQSASDDILVKMNRKYDQTRLHAITNEISSDVELIYDIIVGFPTETSVDFEKTVNFIKDTKPIEIMTCDYSYREGATKFTDSEQISPLVIKKRKNILREIMNINDFTIKNDLNVPSILLNLSFDNIESVVKCFEVLHLIKTTTDERVGFVVNYEADNIDQEVVLKLLFIRYGVDIFVKFNHSDDVFFKNEILDYLNAKEYILNN